MKVRIKVDANIRYEIEDTGRLKAISLLDNLLQDEHITKIKDNVMNSLSNLLYNGYSIEKAYYDMLTNEVELYLYDQPYRVCSKCGFGYNDYPAISREDNVTEICPTCGVKEAMEDFEYGYE